MKVVIRIGGSIIASPLRPRRIIEYAEIIKNLRKQGYELVVVTGGGETARKFIELAKEMSMDQREQDEIAISISRVLAQIFAIKIGGQEFQKIPTSINEAKKNLETKGIVFMGGLKPGMTTDTVAALLASETRAEFMIKATDQKGVYTKDPRKYKDAEKIDELTFGELSRILRSKGHKAGLHQIIDSSAIKILKDNNIKTIIVEGSKPKNIVSALKGIRIGTIIH